jgi:hypothetical protein
MTITFNGKAGVVYLVYDVLSEPFIFCEISLLSCFSFSEVLNCNTSHSMVHPVFDYIHSIFSFLTLGGFHIKKEDSLSDLPFCWDQIVLCWLTFFDFYFMMVIICSYEANKSRIQSLLRDFFIW